MIEIAGEEFRRLRNLIRERFGIYFDDEKRLLLQSRLQTRLLKSRARNFTAYCNLLDGPIGNSIERQAEWDELASVLTNNETYFFREQAQLNVLVGPVLSEALRAGRPLRVWSAACSTGEEPYTLAMILLESGRITSRDVSIRASDLSPRALERACSGFYRELSFRTTPPAIVQKYFRPFEGGFFIESTIKSMVGFSRVNLVDARAVESVGAQDVIFCRNVLIYFDKPTQLRIVSSFARVLRPGGYLFLGHAESIAYATDLYDPVITSDSVHYRRRNDDATPN